MAFTIRPAQRSDSKALIGLYSQSGAGKTYSSLMLARGLVGPAGKIVLIDTESGRGSLYADVIPGGYETINLDPPFSPQRYIEAIEAAEQANAACIIVDSMSHEWEGAGGVGDMAFQIETRTGKPGLHCWKEPKMAHQKMLLKLLQAKTHLICCLRAKRKSRQIKNERTGKSEIVKDEFYTPKQDGDFIFELTVHAEILADHKLRVTKVSHPALENVFKSGMMITEETGRELAAWARGEKQKSDEPTDDKIKQGVDTLIAEVAALKSGDEITAHLKGSKAAKQQTWLAANRPDEYQRLLAAVTAHRKTLDGGHPEPVFDDDAAEGTL
jgi:AAA domain